MDDAQKLMRSLADELQSLQNELSAVIEARQKLESQMQENKAVQKEFASLDDDAKIYKLVGPVLLKQDKTEAVMNVDKRLEFIESEIKRIEGQITDLSAKQDKKNAEIMRIQQQAAAAGGGVQA